MIRLTEEELDLHESRYYFLGAVEGLNDGEFNFIKHNDTWLLVYQLNEKDGEPEDFMDTFEEFLNGEDDDEY